MTLAGVAVFTNVWKWKFCFADLYNSGVGQFCAAVTGVNGFDTSHICDLVSCFHFKSFTYFFGYGFHTIMYYILAIITATVESRPTITVPVVPMITLINAP